MKSLLTSIALVEAAAGIALLIIPSFFVFALLGTPLTEPGAISIARLAGAAIFCLAFACWLSGRENQSLTMVKVMTLYNFLATALLLYVVVIVGISGSGFWPAVLLHTGLLVWCSITLAKRL